MKYMGNRQGLDALSSELICAKLMRRLGIASPAFAVISVPALPPDSLDITIQEGPAFLTSWETNAFTFSGSAEVLRLISNPEVISEIVVFDTLVKNRDRFVAGPSEDRVNLDNVLIVPSGKKVRMMAIDHSHAFIETTFSDELNEDWWVDEELFGYIPILDDFITETYLDRALQAVENLRHEDYSEIVEGVPPEWGLSSELKEILTNCLEKRGRMLRRWLPQCALAEPSFLMGNNL